MVPLLLLYLHQGLGIANHKWVDAVVTGTQSLSLLDQWVFVQDFDGFTPSSTKDSGHHLAVEAGREETHNSEHQCSIRLSLLYYVPWNFKTDTKCIVSSFLIVLHAKFICQALVHQQLIHLFQTPVCQQSCRKANGLRVPIKEVK